eukprot:COSAG01_NODE_4753_length_4766_cov_2.343261_6_plen_189_part_00
MAAEIWYAHQSYEPQGPVDHAGLVQVRRDGRVHADKTYVWWEGWAGGWVHLTSAEAKEHVGDWIDWIEGDIWYRGAGATSHGPVTLAELVEAWRDRRRKNEFPRLVWWEALGGKDTPAWVPIGSEEARRALGDITSAMWQEASPPGSLLRTDAETPASTDGQKRVEATPPHPDPSTGKNFQGWSSSSV